MGVVLQGVGIVLQCMGVVLQRMGVVLQCMGVVLQCMGVVLQCMGVECSLRPGGIRGCSYGISKLGVWHLKLWVSCSCGVLVCDCGNAELQL